MSPDAPTLRVPRWVQLVGLPLLAIAAWLFASAVRHALFVFLVSAVIAVLLAPLVRGLVQLRLSRGLAVLLVFVAFAALAVTGVALVGTVVVTQAQDVSQQIEHEFTSTDRNGRTPAEKDVDDLQRWLDRHRLRRIHVRDLGTQVINNIRDRGVTSYTKRVVDITQTVATSIVGAVINIILVIVISIYMLLDGPRLSRAANRLFPPDRDGRELGEVVQHGLHRYVRGQLLVSLIIGVSVGVGMALLGLVGVWPSARDYAVFFGAFAMVTEIVPYVGPIIGAVPPLVLALFHAPVTALWVLAVFLVIHQLEGHVVVPRVMGSALGAHPLAIIFTLLAGEELYGFAGVLLALPLMAMGREAYLFLRPRIGLEAWPRELGLALGTGAAPAAEAPPAVESGDEGELEAAPAEDERAVDARR